MKVPRALALIMAVMMGLPALVQVALDLRSSRTIRALDVFRRVPTAQSLRAYEHSLSASLEIARRTRPRIAEFWDRTLRRGNEKVTQAPGGWFFYVPGTTFIAAPGLEAIHIADMHQAVVRKNPAFDAIVAFNAQLAGAGITLVLVAIPEKATVVPEHLGAGLPPDAAPNNRSLVAELERLAARGVFVLELTAPLLEAKAAGVPVFLPRDTHWTPEASKLAARFVADRVRALPAFKAVTPTITEFDHRLVEYQRRGDLFELLAYAEQHDDAPITTFVVEQVLAIPGGSPPIAADSPILLLGDSFSAIYGEASYGMGERGGFAEHLADELSMPIDVISVPGGGPMRARELFSRRPNGASGKKVVVWELAERNLLDKEVVWANLPLPETKAPAEPRAAAATGSTELRVRARLSRVSQLPDQLPYGDCLVVSRYESEDGAAPGPLFVAVWGRKDWKAITDPRLVDGRAANLTLVPLRERIDIERTCFTENVGLSGPLYWADEITIAK